MTSNAPRRFLVGIDGSAESLTALRWAVDLADDVGARVDLLAAWQLSASYLMPIVGAPLPPTQMFEEAARHRLEAAAAAVGLPDDAKRSVICGHPGVELASASADYDLVVVGRTGRGRLERLLLGSTARHVARHAHAPVALVNAPEVARRVTVAFDGSHNAIGALRWITGLGADVKITVTSAHDERILEELALDDGLRTGLDERAMTHLETTLADAGFDTAALAIETRSGDPRTLLVDTLADDELLVMGGFGHSPIAGMIGSLAGYAIEHCPGQLLVWRD